MREVVIRPVLNGWHCRVGCQEVVFTDRDILIATLRDYMTDAPATENAFTHRAVNQGLLKRPNEPMVANATVASASEPRHGVGQPEVAAEWRPLTERGR